MLFSDEARTISDRGGGDSDDNSRCRDGDDAINASVVVRIRPKSMPISSNSIDTMEDVEHIIVTLWVFFYGVREDQYLPRVNIYVIKPPVN
jgi:hypothetical protein